MLLTTTLLLVLVSCSPGEEPVLIGSYPHISDTLPVEYPPMAQTTVVYNAYLELLVSNTDRSAEKVNTIALRNGGYLVSSQAWYQDSRRHFSITIAVPAYNYPSTYRSLLALGKLESERVTGELVSEGYGGWTPYSHISVHLKPRSKPLLSLPSFNWDPMNTLNSAFSVFVSIFGFLLDVLIWIVVVIGPFILIGWGVKAILTRRLEKPKDH
jgi:hypothetical protein